MLFLEYEASSVFRAREPRTRKRLAQLRLELLGVAGKMAGGNVYSYLGSFSGPLFRGPLIISLYVLSQYYFAKCS